MKPQFTKTDLAQYFNKTEILIQTANQTIKDFALFGLDISFPTDINFVYKELFEQLEVQISDLLSSGGGKLYSILYQIDIPEIKIRETANNNPELSLDKVITELILERELKKVLTRLHFKNQGYSS